jgi:hypothetical protein
MAVHTGIHRWYRRMPRFFGSCMTIQTLDLMIASVFFMAKWNGLLRGIALIGGGWEKPNHSGNHNDSYHQKKSNT